MIGIDEVGILLVEDIGPTRARVKAILETPPPTLQAVHSLPRFRVIDVASKQAALDQLRQARIVGNLVIDLVILDLGIPETDGAPWYQSVGLDFLPELRESGFPVIVFSQYVDVANLTRVINEQATGFVAKPTDEQSFAADAYAPVVQVVAQVWRRIAEQGWADCRTRRLREWVLALSGVLLGDRMRTAVSHGLTRVAACADQIDEIATANPAAAGPLATCRRELQQVIQETTAQTEQAFTESLGAAEYTTADDVKPIRVGQIVHEKLRELRSGILSRNLTVTVDTTPDSLVWLPPRPVGLLLEGLLFHAISETPVGHAFAIAVHTVDHDARVRIDLPNELMPQVVEILQGGAPAVDFHDEATWGVALIRRLMEVLAGSIEIQKSSGKTTLTLTLPGVGDAAHFAP